jgi:hypothetical protein
MLYSQLDFFNDTFLHASIYYPSIQHPLLLPQHNDYHPRFDPGHLASVRDLHLRYSSGMPE